MFQDKNETQGRVLRTSLIAGEKQKLQMQGTFYSYDTFQPVSTNKVPSYLS